MAATAAAVRGGCISIETAATDFSGVSWVGAAAGVIAAPCRLGAPATITCLGGCYCCWVLLPVAAAAAAAVNAAAALNVASAVNAAAAVAANAGASAAAASVAAAASAAAVAAAHCLKFCYCY